MGDKIDDATKTDVESAIASLKTAMETEDTDEIKRLSEALTQTSHKLAEAMYQQASQAQEEQGADGTDTAAGQGAGAADDDVVDADFEEVKEEDAK